MNKMHGQGVFKWSDGRVYDGFFVNDYRQGQGSLTWPDNSKYEGTWLKGKQDGIGYFTDEKHVR